jgi:hypothetical protein
MKNKFREMHDHVQEQQMKEQSAAQHPSPKPRSGDYIDFEEIK